MTGRARRFAGVWLSALPLATSLVVAQEQRPTFRSTTGAVRVDVAVLNGGRPMPGLTIKDFAILDEGVPQTITDLSYGKLPIDVTVALDVSNSVTGELLDALRRSVNDLQSRLGDGDRLKLMAFNMRVARLLDYSPRNVSTAAAFGGLSGSGTTSIIDTLAVALTSAAPQDRRQLIILFSDGRDTASIGETDDILEVAWRTTPTLAFVGPFGVNGPTLPTSLAREITSPLGGVPPQRPGATTALPAAARSMNLFARLADITGGVVVPLPATGAPNLQGTFGDILADFRSSYVLYFTPSGAAAAGFHQLDVRLTRQGPFEVRARRGYVRE